jgi:hypothetical protein
MKELDTGYCDLMLSEVHLIYPTHIELQIPILETPRTK